MLIASISKLLRISIIIRQSLIRALARQNGVTCSDLIYVYYFVTYTHIYL